MPVIGIVTPIAVIVEVFKTHDIGRQILNGARRVITMIASIDPHIELIGFVDRLDIGVESTRSVKISSLPGFQRISLAAAGYYAIASPDTNHGVTAVFTSLHPIASGVGNGECEIRRVDLEVVLMHAPDTNVDGSRA
jgi:hypothetical protein